MIKVAYRIEIEGEEGAVSSLKTVRDELVEILGLIEKLNTGLSGDLKKLGDSFAELLKGLAKGGGVGGDPLGGLGDEIPETEDKIESLSQELRRLFRESKDRAGETGEEYDALIARVAELKAQQKGVTDEIKEQQRALEANAFDAGSYRELNADLGKLRASYRLLGKEARESVGGREQLAQIQKLDKELKDLDKTMGISFRNVGNYRDAIRGLNGVVAKLGAFSIGGIGGREVIDENVKIADSISDVRKTTELGSKAIAGYDDVIQSLGESLKDLDTRTGLDDLLQIAAIGGQLGVVKEFTDEFERLKSLGDDVGANEALAKAEAELFDFTESINRVNVSLGDSLEGDVDDIARDFGRLNSLLGTKDEFGTSQGIDVLASAFNTLGASSEAAEGPMIDFTKRVAPLAQQAKLAAEDVIGFSSVFDELGLGPELTSTAFTKFVLSIGADVDKFADIAGKTKEEFRGLLESDGNEAIISILEGIQAEGVLVDEGGNAIGGGVEKLNNVLKQLGVEGSARAAQTIGGLADNVDLLRTRQAQASEEFGIARGEIEGLSSVTVEYEEKNNNLAASYEKLVRGAKEVAVNQGIQDFLNAIFIFLAKVIRAIPVAISGFLSIAKAGVKFAADFGAVLVLLTGALLIYNKQAIIANALKLKELTIDKLLARGKKALIAVEAAYQVLLKLNPITAIISGVLLLIGVLGGLVRRYEGLRDKFADFFNQLDKFFEGLGPIGIGFRFLFGLIRVGIDAIANFGATFEGLKAAVSQVIDNVVSDFEVFVNKAKILGIQIRQAFTFDDAKDDILAGQIKELEEANKGLERSQVNVAEAYDKAFRTAVLAQEKQEALEAERKKNEPSQGEGLFGGDGGLFSGGGSVDGLAGGLLNQNPTEDGEDDGNDYGDGRNGAELEKERQLAEKRAELRLSSLKKIRDIETSFIKDDLTRSLVEAENENTDKREDLNSGREERVEGASGDELAGIEAEIKRESELIQEALLREYDEIFGNAREALLEKSKEGIGNIGKTNGLLPSVEEIKEETVAINTQLSESIVELEEVQRKRLEAQGFSEEEVLSSLEVLREEFAERERTQIQENNAKSRDLQVESLDQRLEIEKQRREERLSRRIIEIQEEAEIEGATRAEIDERIKEAKEESEEEELNDLKIYWEERARIADEGSVESIRIQAELADLELRMQREKVDKLLLEEERLKKGKKAALDASLRSVSSFVGGVKDLLSEDEENRKKYGKAIKAAALAEIAINLAREISAISVVNTRFGEPFDTIVRVAKIADAVVRAGVQAVAVKNETLGEGGDVDGVERVSGRGKDDDVKRISSGAKKLKEGMLFGAGHDSGGIDVVTRSGKVVNVEGGERVVDNGNETYVINRRSSAKFSSQINALEGSRGGGYDPVKREVVSSINSFNGWGVKFASGGDVDMRAYSTRQLNQSSPVPAILPGEGGANGMSGAIREQAELFIKGIEKVVEKVEGIDAPVVNNYISSEEVVRDGLKRINEKGNGFA